jgi:hypothetical protein
MDIERRTPNIEYVRAQPVPLYGRGSVVDRVPSRGRVPASVLHLPGRRGFGVGGREIFATKLFATSLLSSFGSSCAVEFLDSKWIKEFAIP